MDKYSLYEIKGALTFVRHIQAMQDSRETLDEMSREHQILILSHREAFLSWGSPVRFVPE